MRLPVLAISRTLLSALDTAGASASALGSAGPAAVAALAALLNNNSRMLRGMDRREGNRMREFYPFSPAKAALRELLAR